MGFKDQYKKWWKGLPKPVRQFVNKIDTPWDKFKEWLHGHDLPFGYKLDVSFMMANRVTRYPIIVKADKFADVRPVDWGNHAR
jgi:hypothetical protein